MSDRERVDRLCQELQGKRLVFTVTTGRSGTAYLSHMLSLVPGTSSHHEPMPCFSDVMRDVQGNPRLADRFWVDRKLPAILQTNARIYAETSHVFCKGFLEPLLCLGIVPDLILLKRAHRRVALSLCRLDTVPGRSELGLRWLLSPDDPGVLPLPRWQDLSDYQLCYWYCLEIERRAGIYADLLRERGARVVTTSIAALKTASGFRTLLRQLELPELTALGRVGYYARRNRRLNIRRNGKEDASLSAMEEAGLQHMEQAVLALVEWPQLGRPGRP
jgi:hypothetical protein